MHDIRSVYCISQGFSWQFMAVLGPFRCLDFRRAELPYVRNLTWKFSDGGQTTGHHISSWTGLSQGGWSWRGALPTGTTDIGEKSWEGEKLFPSLQPLLACPCPMGPWDGHWTGDGSREMLLQWTQSQGAACGLTGSPGTSKSIL